jgi:Mg2+ and Co2+ transporter CorA
MRVFSVGPGGAQELDSCPTSAPEHGFLWLALERAELETDTSGWQQRVLALTGIHLVDLHISDLINAHLPSRYDYTDSYDLLVFRRLAAAGHTAPAAKVAHKGGPPVLRRIDTSPVGFALFDHLLLSVHPSGCGVLAQHATRLLAAGGADHRPALARSLPASAAELMLRLTSLMVDAYLDLRRDLSRQLDHWQTELLHPRTRFSQWDRLLQARMALHQLDEICEDQRNAIQAWVTGMEPAADKASKREQEMLKLRARDVLEHIERVVHHVRRLEHNAETTVQMHFSVQGNRTNDIMRTLTVLTAIFLPLNLITGIFGMNFDSIPLLHNQRGFWWAMAAMGAVAVGLVLVFWRKRYLEQTSERSGDNQAP